MTAVLFRDAGQVATLGNVPVVLPLGRAVGGSTAINSATCFRTPARVFETWVERFGLDCMDPDLLDPFFRRVERELGVAQVPPELAGQNAAVVKRGADALGRSGDYVYRNAQGCVGSGICQWGCPASAKRHVGVTHVPRAWDAGAVTYTGTRARRLVVERGRVRAVEATTRGGGHVRVECDAVVVACGAIGTPLLLRRQPLPHSPQLGRNLTLHPATGVRAVFDETIDMAVGVPQSYYVDEFAGEGIMFEGAAGPPDYMAMSLPFSGDRHRELMLGYRHMSQFGVMVSDHSRGSVRERFGAVEIRYNLGADDVATFKRAIELLCELYWAAGAKVVYPPVERVGELRDGDLGPLRSLDMTAQDLTPIAFHLLGAPPPDDEPQPESIAEPRVGAPFVA